MTIKNIAILITRKNIAMLITALGAIVCLFFGAGGSSLCGTSGCEMYSGYSFLGISFYFWGAIGFAIAFSLVAINANRWAKRLAAAILICDTGFLLYMTLFWPCVPCLIAALFMAALFISLHRPLRRPATALLTVWLCLFSFNFIQASLETVEPWAAHDPENARMTLYFSPTCPTCEDTLRSVLKDKEMLEETRIVPVAHNDEDYDRIIRMRAELCQGEDISQALYGLFEEEPDLASKSKDACWSNIVKAKLSLLANKHVVSTKGWKSVPKIESAGVVAQADTEGGGQDEDPFAGGSGCNTTGETAEEDDCE